MAMNSCGLFSACDKTPEGIGCGAGIFVGVPASAGLLAPDWLKPELQQEGRARDLPGGPPRSLKSPRGLHRRCGYSLVVYPLGNEAWGCHTTPSQLTVP